MNDQNKKIRYVQQHIYADIPISKKTYNISNNAKDILLIENDEEMASDLMYLKLYDVFDIMDRMRNYPKIKKEYSIKFVK